MRLDAAQLAALLSDTLPEIDYHGVEVEEVGDQEVRLRLPYDAAFVGAGGIFSGPTLLGFADTALYAAAQAVTGDSVRALVSNLSVTFLKPAMAADVIAISRVISRTAKTVHLEAWLFSHAAVDPILHATATSILRPAE